MSRLDDGPTRIRGWQEPGIRFTPAADPAATPPASAADPFSMFDDPSTQFLTNIIHNQIGSLSAQPQMDPTTAGLMAFLGGQLGNLSNAAPIAFDSGNGLLGDFITEGRQRIAELNQAPFTSAEETALKAKTRNDALAQRDASMQRSLERASARGLGKSSGVLEADQQSIENSFTSADAKAQNDLMLWIADQAQQRKNQAATIAQQLAGAGQADAAMRMQGQIAASSANQNRQGMVMGLANSLAQMAAQSRGEARARQGDILQLSTLLAELPVQRLQLAMSVLNGTGGNNIPSLFQNVSSLNQAQTQAQQRGDAQQAAFLQSLAALASYFGNKK